MDTPRLDGLTPEERKKVVANENLKKAREAKKRKAEELKKQPVEQDIPSYIPDLMEEDSNSSLEEPIPTPKKTTITDYKPKKKSKHPKKKRRTMEVNESTKEEVDKSWYYDYIPSQDSTIYTAAFFIFTVLLRAGIPQVENYIQDAFKRDYKIPSDSMVSKEQVPTPIQNQPTSPPDNPNVVSYIG